MRKGCVLISVKRQTIWRRWICGSWRRRTAGRGTKRGEAEVLAQMRTRIRDGERRPAGRGGRDTGGDGCG
ncbi:hypothetical protein GCM10017782_26940 [Deinococcus ficus]|nr:hypothetical protein GCM10017782_26940 [Deinococcus ficus]